MNKPILKHEIKYRKVKKFGGEKLGEFGESSFIR